MNLFPSARSRPSLLVLATFLAGITACSQPLSPRALVGHYQAIGISRESYVTEATVYQMVSSSVTVSADSVILRDVHRETTRATGAVRLVESVIRMGYVVDGRRVRTSVPDGIEAVVRPSPDFLLIGDVLVLAPEPGGRGWTYERRPSPFSD